MNSVSDYVKAVVVGRSSETLVLTHSRSVDLFPFASAKSINVGNDYRSVLNDWLVFFCSYNSVVNQATISKFRSVASEVHICALGQTPQEHYPILPIFDLSKPTVGWRFKSCDASRQFSRTEVRMSVWIYSSATTAVRRKIRQLRFGYGKGEELRLSSQDFRSVPPLVKAA